MFKKKNIILIWILLTSCSQVQPNIINPSVNNSTQDQKVISSEPSVEPSNRTIDNPVSQPTNPIGNTGYTPTLSEDDSKAYINPVENSNPLPQVSGSGSLSAIGTIKNNPLLSRETITNKQGYTGSYLEVLNNSVLPIVNTYAKDLKFIRASGGTDKLGKTINRKLPLSMRDMFDLPPYYEWQFYFISPEKNESYTVRVNYQETIITKEKWSNNDFGFIGFSVKDIKIDSTEIVKILENAVKDKNKISKKVINANASNIVEINEFQENRDYSFILEQKEGNLVWNIRTSEQVEHEFMEKILKFPPDNRNPDYSYSGTYEPATANINATTGEIIDFSRPTGIYFIDKNSTYFKAPST